MFYTTNQYFSISVNPQYFSCCSLLFQDALSDLTKLQSGLKQCRDLTKQLALHFCEDQEKFQLQECMQIFSGFCDKIKQCEKVKWYSLI